MCEVIKNMWTRFKTNTICSWKVDTKWNRDPMVINLAHIQSATKCDRHSDQTWVGSTDVQHSCDVFC